MSNTRWSRIPKNIRKNVHGMCSYLAMFPPNIPNYFIKKYTKEGDVVLDPFSGRGTTITEASYLNRKAIGSDLNPLAIVLSRAKVSVPSRNSIIRRIKKIETDFKKSKKNSIINQEKNIKMIFNPSTLRELVFLQDNLNWKKNRIDNYITAMILGILHGGSKNYLSIQMPNTFSMSPNYIKSYIKKEGLKKEYRNVFKCLRKKFENCYDKPNIAGNVFKQNALKMNKVKKNSVNLIITSPPYLDVIKYGQYNWIRLWFIKEGARKIDQTLFTSQSLNKYVNFMKDFLNQSKKVLKRNGKIILIIGDVRGLNLAKKVWENSAEPLGYVKEYLLKDEIDENTKTTKIWNERKGKATKIDRVLILSN